jgi:Fe-S cluster assembly ATP-binding protein
VLQLKNLGLTLNGKQILYNLDLETRSGKIHGILGANGTGKPTLASVILGLSSYREVVGNIVFLRRGYYRLSCFGTGSARNHCGLAGAGEI